MQTLYKLFSVVGNQIQKQTKEFQETKPRKSWSSRKPPVALPTVARRSQPYPVSMTMVKSRSASRTVSRKVRGSGRQNKSVNGAVLSYPTSTQDNYMLSPTLPNDVCVTSGQGQTEGQDQNPAIHIPNLNAESLFHNDILMVGDTTGSLISDGENAGTFGTLIKAENESAFGTLIKTENECAESSTGIADGLYGGDEGSDNVTEEIVAGQVEETEDLEIEDPVTGGHILDSRCLGKDIYKLSCVTDLLHAQAMAITAKPFTGPKKNVIWKVCAMGTPCVFFTV